MQQKLTMLQRNPCQTDKWVAIEHLFSRRMKNFLAKQSVKDIMNINEANSCEALSLIEQT